MAMTCGTRSTPDAAQFSYCVSPDYNPSITLVDGAPSTANEFSRYQWNLRQILEGEQYDSLFADAPRDVKVAVIDTYPGSQGHPNLVNRYETGINLVEGGTNCNPPTWDGNPPTGSNSHGQGVASVIAAEHGTTGIAGVFHRARIIPVRASFDTLDQAILQAVAAGAEIVHVAGWEAAPHQDDSVWPDLILPAQWPLRWMLRDVPTATYEKERMTAIRSAIETVTWDSGAIVSAVIGNWDGRCGTHLIANHHETIATSAVNILGEPSPFNSNTHSATILAPGGDRRQVAFPLPGGTPPNWFGPFYDGNPDDVPMCIGPNKWSWGSGGSFAGPHTAAACAIIKSYLPDAKSVDARRLITRSKQPIMLNLHLLQAVGGMLSLKRLKAAILAEP